MSFTQSDHALVDCSQFNPKFAGIKSALTSQDEVGYYIHEQFLEHAHSYAATYDAVPFFRILLEDSLKDVDPALNLLALDIGSGAGNSVLALLEMFPNIHVVATDVRQPI